MENNLSFEQLRNAVFQLFEKLNNIENLLLNKTNQPETDILLTIQQVGQLIKLSVPTLYGYVSRNEIPFFKKGKRLYFSEKKLINWGKTGRKKNISKINSETNTVFKKSGELSWYWVFIFKVVFEILKTAIVQILCK